MANITPSLPPGAYPSDRTIKWSFAPNVMGVSYTVNGLPPVLSEYIAYDQLVPPNPFTAVTQDGRGNVVYDGGFPKFYNSQAGMNHTATSFSQLGPTQKFLHNAINWCANPTTIQTHGKKILILGDANAGESYSVKDTVASGFRTTFTGVCNMMGFTPTFKTRSDWGGRIDVTLTELEQYACVIFMSSAFTVSDYITDRAVQDLVTYRALGSGLIFITDHGAFINNIQGAWPTSTVSSFMTANKVIRNFGAYFSGDYNRSPVNVGFLRQNYGDHPLYNGLNDSEMIFAGGSESRVVVQEYPLVVPEIMPDTPITTGTTDVRFLLRFNDGRVETHRFIYNVAGDGDLLEFTDNDGNTVTEVDIGWGNGVSLNLQILTTDLGTILGGLFRNTERIGEFRYDQSQGSQVTWYAGEGTPNLVNDGDQIRGVIEQPFTYEKTVTIRRQQVRVPGGTGGAVLTAKLLPLLPGTRPQQTLKAAVSVINAVQTMPYTHSHADNLQRVQQYMNGTFPLTDLKAYAFNDGAALSAFLGSYIPPTPAQIFNTWDRIEGDAYFPKGVGATGDAATWYWDAALGRAVQPSNSALQTGFISEEKTDNYDLTVTLTSTSTDDDWNIVTLAYVRDEVNGLNHSLDVAVCPSATNDTSIVKPNFYIQRDHGATGERSRLIVKNDFNNISAGWSNKQYRVWTQRRGDQFTVYGSGWNTLTRKAESVMSFNLNDHPDLAIFKGPRAYGFASMSQPESSFKDIYFYGGLIRNVVLDITNNRIYRWTGTQWAVVNNVTLHQIFGTPRIIEGITNGIKFRLNRDGTITRL